MKPMSAAGWRAYRNGFAGGGAAALAAALILGWYEPRIFFQSYLASWLFFVGLALGGMFFLMVRELTGGRWGIALRPPLEAAMSTLPLLFVLAIPLAFGLRHLIAPGESSSEDELRRWYLSSTVFITREAIFLFLWCVLALSMRGLLRRPAEDPRRKHLRALAAAGIIVYFITVTAAAYDWIAALIPEFASTAIGVRLGATQALGGVAFGILALVLLSRLLPGWEAPPIPLHVDFGNLLLASVAFLGYVAYMAYLIVWSADLPHEIAWYAPRVLESWHWLTLSIVVCELLVPAFAMLFQRVKREPRALAAVCLLVLVAQWFDNFWLTVPSLRPDGVTFYALDFIVLAALGGLWIAGLMWLLAPGRPIAAEAARPAVAHG
jgi:hypothetical protein